MKSRWMLSSLLMSLLVLTGCEQIIGKFTTEQKIKQARIRVDLVFTGINKGGSSMEMQTAIGMWYQGVRVINDMAVLDHAYDAFDRWQKAKGIYRNVKTWEILEAQMLPTEGGEPATVLVTAKVNKKTLKMKVPEGDQIAWTR